MVQSIPPFDEVEKPQNSACQFLLGKSVFVWASNVMIQIFFFTILTREHNDRIRCVFWTILDVNNTSLQAFNVELDRPTLRNRRPTATTLVPGSAGATASAQVQKSGEAETLSS